MGEVIEASYTVRESPPERRPWNRVREQLSSGSMDSGCKGPAAGRGVAFAAWPLRSLQQPRAASG